MIDLKRTVFFVDGPTEIYSFKGKFGREYRCYPNFRVSGCNGRDVPVAGYVNAVWATLLLALTDCFENLVFILDKEQRKISAEKFALNVFKEIEKRIRSHKSFKNYDCSNIKVFVSDICFENWIVADIEGIKKLTDLIDSNATQDNFEGKSGTSILKKIMRINYRKTTHAAKLFKEINFKSARDNSASFKDFAEKLGLIDD